MPESLASRAPAFLAISLPFRPYHSTNITRSTTVARTNHPKYVFRPRPIRIATANGAEEEVFIRRHAEGAKKKDEKVEEQFDFVTQQKDKKDDPNPKLSESDVLPDLKAPPPPSPEVVPAKTAPRVSAETKKLQKSEQTTQSGKKRNVRVIVPNGITSMADRIRGDFSRLISESHVGSQMRIPTGQETITAVWELVAVFAVLVLLRAGVASTLRWIHNRLNTTRGLKSNIPYEASVFECMQRPLEFLSLFTVGTALAEAISRPLAATGLLRHIMTLRELGIIFSATWFLLRWIDRIRSRFAVDKRVDKSQVDATSRIATVATFIVSLLISLDTIGINVQTVLAFGGIGGVAIGFAGREIISNFFGGFMIYVTRPFSVGEWIRSIEESELNGTVEDIGWYLTRVRTWDKRPLYIPNSRFSTLIVENPSRMANRRILHTIHLRHEDMPVIPQIIADVEKLLMSHSELDPRQHRLAYVDSFDEFSVKVWLSCYTKSVFLYDFRRVQQDVLVKFYDIVRARGAKLATRNTRDVRPGVDTDRYGAHGSAATFGAAVAGVPQMENVPASVPVNSDVPGAPLYGVPQTEETLHTIESGIDLSKLTQPSVPNGVPVKTPAGEAVAPVAQGQSEKNWKQRPLSNAAVAATAAAFLAARRNAMRKEGMQESTKSESVRSKVESSEKPVVGSETKAGSAPSVGGMKITAAPPRGGSAASGPASTTSSADGPGTGPSESKGTEDGTSPISLTVGSSPHSGKPVSEETTSLPRSVSGTTPPPAVPTGEMKITKARKSKSMSPTPTSKDEVGEPPLPETPSASSKRSSEDAAEKLSAEKRLSDDRSAVRAMQSAQSSSAPGEDAATSPGLMKISAARSPKPTGVSAEIKREGTEGDRVVPDGASEGSRVPSPGSNEARTVSKPPVGNQAVPSTTSSSGSMKITSARTSRPSGVSAESRREVADGDRSASDETSEVTRVTSAGSKETRPASKPQVGGQGATVSPTSSGSTKVTGTRPLRGISVSPDSDGTGSMGDTPRNGKTSASLSSTSPSVPIGERLSQRGKAPNMSQPQKPVGDSGPSGNQISSAPRNEAGSISEVNENHRHQADAAESKQTRPSPKSELDSGSVEG